MSAIHPTVVEKTSAQSDRALIEQWLDKFNVALHSGSASSVAALFAQDSHWRDVLAFTWSLTPREEP